MKGRGKKIGLVALSAVMAGTLGLSFTACSGTSSDTITVYIFCGESDRFTYQNLIDTWAEEYVAPYGSTAPRPPLGRSRAPRTARNPPPLPISTGWAAPSSCSWRDWAA